VFINDGRGDKGGKPHASAAFGNPTDVLA